MMFFIHIYDSNKYRIYCEDKDSHMMKDCSRHCQPPLRCCYPPWMMRTCCLVKWIILWRCGGSFIGCPWDFHGM